MEGTQEEAKTESQGEWIEQPLSKDPRFENLADRCVRGGSVLYYAGKKGRFDVWICRCDCGAMRPVYAANIRSKNSVTCFKCGIKSRRKQAVETRFWSKVSKVSGLGPNGDCWEWIGSTKRGYGQFSIEEKNWSAHRLAWIFQNGHIDEQICVCHTCDNPLCVKVAHLFLGTHGQNAEDRANKNRSARGDTSGMSRLKSADIPLIRQQRADGLSISEIAKGLDVCRNTIVNVLKVKTWKHV